MKEKQKFEWWRHSFTLFQPTNPPTLNSTDKGETKSPLEPSLATTDQEHHRRCFQWQRGLYFYNYLYIYLYIYIYIYILHTSDNGIAFGECGGTTMTKIENPSCCKQHIICARPFLTIIFTNEIDTLTSEKVAREESQQTSFQNRCSLIRSR